MEEIKVRYMSRKEYLEKYDSNVGYALYVIDNIKKDDYARLKIYLSLEKEKWGTRSE